MTEEEAIEFLKEKMKNWRKYMSEDKELHAEDIVINLIQKQDTEINKLKRALDEMANTLDLNLSLSIENYKFGKKEKIKEYFMKEDK